MELVAFLEVQQHILLLGMGVLFLWAVGNISISAYSLFRKPVPTEKRLAFYQMNLAWGLVNSMIVVWGITHPPFDGVLASIPDLLKEIQEIKSIFLVNVGLDMVYVMVGYFLFRRNSGKRPLRTKGFGQSILLQGGFLFLFDLILWTVFHQQELVLHHLAV